MVLVKEGDTLFELAASAGISNEDIIALNPQLGDINLIRIGSTINTGPTAPPAVTAPSVPTATFETSPTLASKTDIVTAPLGPDTSSVSGGLGGGDVTTVPVKDTIPDVLTNTDGAPTPPTAPPADPDDIPEVSNTVTRQVFKTLISKVDNTRAIINRDGQMITARVNSLIDMLVRVQNGESDAWTVFELQKMLAAAFSDPEYPTKAADTPSKTDDDTGADGLGLEGEDEEEGNGLTTTNPNVDQDLLDRVPPGPGSNFLQFWLEQNEQAVFQALINSFRAKGVAGVFLRFLTNNFQSIWGMYLGEVAQLVINGGNPEDMRFVDWLQKFDTTGTFFSLSAFDRGDPSSRYASVVKSSGVNR